MLPRSSLYHLSNFNHQVLSFSILEMIPLDWTFCVIMKSIIVFLVFHLSLQYQRLSKVMKNVCQTKIKKHTTAPRRPSIVWRHSLISVWVWFGVVWVSVVLLKCRYLYCCLDCFFCGRHHCCLHKSAATPIQYRLLLYSSTAIPYRLLRIFLWLCPGEIPWSGLASI